MSTDPIVSSELKSLRDELAVSQRARTSPNLDRSVASDTQAAEGATKAAVQSEGTVEDEKRRGEFREIADELTKFFDEAEKNLSAHPVASMVGALVVGILIGRLLGPGRS